MIQLCRDINTTQHHRTRHPGTLMCAVVTFNSGHPLGSLDRSQGVVLTNGSTDQSLHPQSHAFNKLLWPLDGPLGNPDRNSYMEMCKANRRLDMHSLGQLRLNRQNKVIHPVRCLHAH